MKADSSRAIGRGDDGRPLALPGERPKAPAQPHLRFPGNLAHRPRCGRNLHLLLAANTWMIPIAPSSFDQDTPRPTIASLGDTAAVDRVSRGAFGGYETEIPHQLAGVLKARQIADLGQHRHCRNEIYPAHRLQGGDDLGKRPLGHRVTDRLLQTLDTLALLAHRPQKLFERNPLLAMLELLQHKPIHVGRAPRLLAWKMSSEPKHERGDLLSLAFEVFPRCLTGAREISHRLMPLVGHPDRGEFPGAQYLGQAYRIASVRLHPIARFLRDERGCRHDAVVAKLPDQPIEPVSRRPRLVAKRQLTVFGRKFGDELARRRFRGVDLAKIANIPATTILRDRNRIAQL